MKKEDFRRAVRSKLMQTPLQTRRTWNGTDLLTWWSRAHQEDSYLTWERVPGDIWQHVHAMCSDLIGEKAVT